MSSMNVSTNTAGNKLCFLQNQNCVVELVQFKNHEERQDGIFDHLTIEVKDIKRQKNIWRAKASSLKAKSSWTRSWAKTACIMSCSAARTASICRSPKPSKGFPQRCFKKVEASQFGGIWQAEIKIALRFKKSYGGGILGHAAFGVAAEKPQNRHPSIEGAH